MSGTWKRFRSPPGYLALHDNYRTALVFTSELSGPFLSYDIQTVRDLALKTAGLTIGNAAACMLLRRKPFPGGGIRLRGINTFTAPDHWHLCQVPIGGTLVSSSVELMRLGKYIPPWVTERLGMLGMKPDDIDHYVFHQPSEIMVRKFWRTSASIAPGASHARDVRQHREREHRCHVQPATRGADREARRQAGAGQRGRRLFHGDGDRGVDGVSALIRPH